MNEPPHIRSLRAQDVAAVADVLRRAYPDQPDFTARLHGYLTIQKMHTFVADAGGVPVGVVIGNDYTTCGYISLMGVDPRVQRSGVATHLMNALIGWADRKQFGWLELDATPAGAPLYRRFGFTDIGLTTVYTSSESRANHAPDLAQPSFERAELFAFDRLAFGADRSEVLGALIDQPNTTLFTAADDAGRLAGYAIAQRGAAQIGPLVTNDPRVARILLTRARARLPDVHRISVTSSAPSAAVLVAGEGYTFTRSLAHMVRGSLASAARERLYARINLGQG